MSSKNTTTLPRPRAAGAATNHPRRAQILVHADIINNHPVGVEALAKFAESDTAMGFDDIQATRPREILSEFGKRGNATQAATRAAISAEASLLGLVASFPVCVKGAKKLDVTAAFLRDAARAKAGPRRDARERAVAAVAAALHRAGVVDRSRHEDRDPKKALLSFDEQCARRGVDAARQGETRGVVGAEPEPRSRRGAHCGTRQDPRRGQVARAGAAEVPHGRGRR